MDVYLAPLVEELKLLWDGVRAYDTSTRCPREDRWFQLHAICMWTIHDSPGLGFISGLAVSGTRGCPTCGPHLEAQYSTPLRSTYYLGHEKYLPLDHPLRDNCTDPIPPYMSMMDYCVLESRIQAGEMPRVASGLNRLSILLELPYWDVRLLIQHLGDAMHEEGNVVKTLLQHIWGKVDILNHRRACVEFGMHPHAWPYTRSNGMEAIPPAEWVLSAHHKRLFIQWIQQLKCPTGYASNFRIAFTHEDIGTWGKGLKTHGFHKLIQDIIPIVMVDLGNDNLRKAIWAPRFGRKFRRKFLLILSCLSGDWW
ncbi:hypothetical protein R1sor_007341 [Riccia sorocarpa]|uniref:Transposase n=1 Tax=Riccia sorocarpa TaxID=122646 RepID=A0ABD3HQ67_9MARC